MRNFVRVFFHCFQIYLWILLLSQPFHSAIVFFMTAFFYICDFLDVSPQEFFDLDTKSPSKANKLFDICRSLDEKQIDNLIAIAKDLKR